MVPGSPYTRPGPRPGDDDVNGGLAGAVMGLPAKWDSGAASDGDASDGAASDSCVGIAAGATGKAGK